MGRNVKKNRTVARTALVIHRRYGPAIVVGKEKNNVFVSYWVRVTKVAPECLRKASVAEQMSWDITTKEKALLNESSEFHESEKPDTLARPQNLQEEVNSPMNDDGDLPFPEPVAEKDDHSEDETQVEGPDPVTEESRDVVREPFRLPQRRLRSKQPPPSVEPEEGVESKSKKARVNVSELLHDASLAKAARSKEKQWHGLNGREKPLFLEAVSKQWNAWQENAAAPAEAKVMWRTLREQGLQDRVMQSRFVLVDKNAVKSTAENPLDTKASARIVVPGYADSRCVGHSERLTNRLS